MKIQGTITHILPVVSGTSQQGTWQKQEVVIEVGNEYKHHVALSAFGDKVGFISPLRVGMYVTADFSPRSREWQGRWFTELRLISIIPQQVAVPTPQPQQPTQQPQFMPTDPNLPF